MLVYKEGNFCAIQIFFIRGGQNFGNKSYFPQQIEESNESEILALFIADFYQHNTPPKLIIINKEPNDKEEIEEIFKTKFSIPKTGDKAKLVDFALQNAKSALISKLLQKETQEKLQSRKRAMNMMAKRLLLNLAQKRKKYMKISSSKWLVMNFALLLMQLNVLWLI